MSNFLPNQTPLAYEPSALEAEFWDPNILSTTNWLDAVIDTEFSGLPFDFDVSGDPLHSWNGPSHAWNAPPQILGDKGAEEARRREQIQSPYAVASNTSVPSGISTETAAEAFASKEGSTSRPGEYYVDGEPARLPRTKRRKLSSKQRVLSTTVHKLSKFSLATPQTSKIELRHRISISEETYQSISNMWQSTCQSGFITWPDFEENQFPLKELFEHLLGLYFVSFHQTCTFIHPGSFNATESNWLLLLAMAAIGARYLGDDGSDLLQVSLQELLRRSLIFINESTELASPDTVTMTQVQMLHAIGTVYSGNDQLVRHGLKLQQTLATAYASLLKDESKITNLGNGTDEDRWNAWVRKEEIIRTAYAIWLLDCMWSYQYQRRPMLALSDATLPLPCHEKPWAATNAQEWGTLSANTLSVPNLPEALQEIYVDKRLPKDRGEFARIIMIHGLFQRTWEVGAYYKDPMSQWEPTARKESSADVLPERPVWLPSVPTYTRWQNSVCDCLDILHWQANAMIGQSSGLEHPTVAFLHLARVVLLSPIDPIVNLAKSMTGLNKDSPSNLTDDKRSIQRWAMQGQYKARLAAIHAGVVFGHIRRYSVDGFYEAPMVGLAALMLWAFGTFSAKQTTRQKGQTANGLVEGVQAQEAASDVEDQSSDDSDCGIILLDRPADDEIVQQFIRRGHTMRAHIGGVGDLYSPRGPERVLAQGCKLLKTLRHWGANAAWLDILHRLQETAKR